MKNTCFRNTCLTNGQVYNSTENLEQFVAAHLQSGTRA